MSKGQGVNGVFVKDEQIEKVIRKFVRITSVVCAEHKKAVEYYEKPSQRRHSKDQEIRKKKGIKKD